MSTHALRLVHLLESDDEAFIRDAYRLILGREADAPGFANYMEQLAAGAPRWRILVWLIESPEARRRGPADPRFAERVVAYARRRDSCPASLDALLELADVEFVLGAYRTVLGRDADPAGLASYVHRVRAGDPKVDVLRSLRASEEGRRREHEWRASGAAQLSMLADVDRAVSAQSWARLPVIGAALAIAFGLESYSLTARRLRRIENLAARNAFALGVGLFETTSAPADAPSAPVTAGPHETGIKVASGRAAADRLLSLPGAFSPGGSKARQ